MKRYQKFIIDDKSKIDLSGEISSVLSSARCGSIINEHKTELSMNVYQTQAREH